MDFKDASPDIAAISQNYSYHPAPNWLIRLQDAVREILQGIEQLLNHLTRIPSPGGADSKAVSSVMMYAVYAAGFIALIAIVYYFWKRARQASEEEASTKRGATAVEKILDSEGYRNESAKHAGSGDYKSACRYLYLCFLQLMHEKNVTAFAPAKTNYEYRYILAAHPALQGGFKDLAETVELVWFGNKTADNSDYEQCKRILEGLEPEIERISSEKARLAAATEMIGDVG
ncbi:MAG: DUF4129 domain-containing protein [Candidatus Obscuribacterales bacterium]|nr:DUF4129 domain-containing protein [Candidatus Obscuribacterales bacterium]